jgi:hypothetical protein
MKRLLLAVAVVVAAVPAAPAATRANPIATEITYGAQVPESMHVQIAFFCGGFEGEGPECPWPLYVERDGVKLGAPWIDETVSLNGGSGISDYDARQICDCNLAPGSYKYVFIMPEGEGTYAGTELTVQVTDPPPPPEEPEPMPEGEEVMPWDIPDGPWPKGVDCVKWCADNPVIADPTTEDVVTTPDTVTPPPDTVIPTPDTVTPTPDQSPPPDAVVPLPEAEPEQTGPEAVPVAAEPEPSKSGKSSCAVGSSGRPAGLLLLLLVLAGARFVTARRGARA